MNREAAIMGTYVLAVRLDNRRELSVGRLGRFDFPAGWYLYVGSAMGSGGLPARLRRHRRRLVEPSLAETGGKRAHWHIDTLRDAAVWHGAWVGASGDRLECTWADLLLQRPDAASVAPGFGASDCQCLTHLVWVPELPTDAWFVRMLGAERFPMGDEALYGLLDSLATGDDTSREETARALARLGPVAIEPLSKLLASESADTRWWAARALAELGGPETVPPLVRALADPEPDVQACAALALGQSGDGAAAAPLASCLADESTFAASIAGDALCMLGETAVPALSEALAGSSIHARLLSVRALSRIGSESAIEPLIGLLDDPSYLVQYYAREALGELGVGMTYFMP